MTVIVPLQEIAATMHKRVCPLYSFDAAGKPQLVGSAVPFATDRGAFLLTAAHVCFSSNRQPIPLFTWTDSGPLALREFRIAWDYHPGKTPDADVALIALTNADASSMKLSYWFSDAATTTFAEEKTPGVHYMLAGYPFIRNRITSVDQTPPALATHLITGDIRSVEQTKLRDKTDECHFALAFPLGRLEKLNKDAFRIPKPQGMSGGGIWRLDINTKTHLATTPQLVGIGIEYLTSKEAKFFLGTRVQLALSLRTDLYSYMEKSSVLSKVQ